MNKIIVWTQLCFNPIICTIFFSLVCAFEAHNKLQKILKSAPLGAEQRMENINVDTHTPTRALALRQKRQQLAAKVIDRAPWESVCVCLFNYNHELFPGDPSSPSTWTQPVEEITLRPVHCHYFERNKCKRNEQLLDCITIAGDHNVSWKWMNVNFPTDVAKNEKREIYMSGFRGWIF